MKKSLIAWALMCVVACAGWIGHAAGYVADVVVSTARALKNVALDGFKLAANAQADKARSVLPFVQARAFVGRLIKRERVLLSGGWRQCPST